MKWVDKHIEIGEPKRPKKITGTRFAAILGLNRWATPFQTWCEITRTFEKPFEETKYTKAGKVIEPKQAEYMKTYYGMNILTPTAAFGEDYFKTTRGDFFHDCLICGGMWDFLELNSDGKPMAVLEMKTTSRSEDWQDDVPEYYSMQAALYAYLLGLDTVYMVVSFLEPSDYDHPEDFVPSSDNTAVIEFSVSEKFAGLELEVQKAVKWWNDHVLTGISPDYDEIADAEILKELRTNSLNPETEIAEVIKEAELLTAELEKYKSSVAPLEKRLTTVKNIIKEYAEKQFREGDTRVTLSGSSSEWTLTRSFTAKVNETAMKADGIYEQYVMVSPTTRLTVTNKGGNK